MLTALIIACLFRCATVLAAAESRDLRMADAFFEHHAYRLAAEAYKAEIEAQPGLAAVSARLGLGQSYQRMGDFKRADGAYRDLIEAYPSSSAAPAALLGRSLSLQAKGDYAASQSIADDLIAAYPGHHLAAQAAFVHAENLYFMGRYSEADAAYLDLPSRYPGFPRPDYLPYARAWCQYRLAESPSRGGSESLQKEAMEKAATLFAEVAKGWPKGELAPFAVYQQGESYFSLKRYGDAAAAYARVEREFPAHSLVPAARYSIAWCAFEQGHWSEAATAFHKFAVVHESHELAAWAMYLAGVSLAKDGDYDLAQSAYELTLKKYPDSACEDKARYGLAWLATVRKDYPAAIEAYDQFLDQFGDSELAPSALFLKADALYHQQRFASARDAYLLLLKRHPKSVLAEDALFFAAGCSLAQGEFDRAIDEYSQFKRLRPQSPYMPEASLRGADALYGKGQWDEAAAAYNATLRAGGKAQLPYARSGLAWIAFQRRQFSEAAAQWKALADGWPQHVLAAESLLHAGDSLYNLNEYQEALAYYRRAAQSPSRAIAGDAHFQAGWAQYRLKDFDQAYGEWGNAKALALDEARAAEASYWMAWALFRKGDGQAAAKAFGAVREEFPKSHLAGESLLRQADSLYNAKDYEGAIGLYQQVVSLYPNDASTAAALHGIQWCYYSLGRDDEAVAASKAFLEKHKDSAVAPEVQYRVAEHYVNKGDFKTAEKELDTMKVAFPRSQFDINASYWRGQARFKNLKFNEAIQDWKEVLAKEPQHALAPKAAFKVGLAYYRLQEYAEALAAFGRVLDAYGNTPEVAADAAFNRGMTFKRMHREAEAITAYEGVVKAYPDSPLANMSRIRIGYIHEDNRDFDKAVAVYRELSSADQGKLGAEAQYLVGDCLMNQKRAGEALLAYQEVVDRFAGQDAWVVTALAKIGEVEESLGHDNKALEAYERIVSQGGDPSWVASAKKRSEIIRARLGETAPEPAGAAPRAASPAKKKPPAQKAATAGKKGKR